MGRKSRRAEDAENCLHKTAPDLSRAVRSPLYDISLKRAVGFKAIGRSHLHGAAQIRRGIMFKNCRFLGAPRFSPHHRSFLALPENDRDNQDGYDVRHLNHRIDGGAGRVFIGVANRVTGYRGFVGGRSFASMLTVFD
jgi:hypothetical protein